ncbi:MULTISPECIES: hypothetical protein [Clostridium]|uniref:Uncharacterized protein n=1 Tax=Clostridium cadaveris TaxID=1529 RepID=A0A1I2LBU5_9CLOT|nr:hypothetical protein [Clostridium cadaveris]MDU4951659.1 hypothetical protein [Clostridium sp.]MDM8312628.1 hypothetical protein [Clostridium cadaveris]MDY4948450.1 hypothetical protein [Clostridium cadaveris]NME64671.1 hypothetical protein [Clostridium cadaveris]NWK09603.1 hypothetical protein [Clostridium cadaveris]
MVLFIQILAAITMLFFIGMTIAAFVTLNKMFYQMKYKNYILEKLNQNIVLLRKDYVDDQSFYNDCDDEALDDEPIIEKKEAE